MKSEEQELSPTGQFALACEQMNEFARSLRDSRTFDVVRTGADIRYYEAGWRLEKWVEAEVDRSAGLWAAWWLDFGPKENGWLIESHLAMSPDVFFVGLEDRFATSHQEIGQQLSAAVENLEHALDQHHQFAEEIRKRKRTGPVC